MINDEDILTFGIVPSINFINEKKFPDDASDLIFERYIFLLLPIYLVIK